ncbi:MAG: aryl-alcohol dehydrogenase-like predicted oxidoreductase [Cognaticolwellia sp.]|jgi:aryl-alcohol dehydrogenase-like predicted oxidoreductase
MSLKNLHRDKIETLLFHRAENLLNHPKKELLFEQLQGLKSQGKVNRIGVSVYSPEQLKKIALNYPIELAQVPMNVFDQRFISSDMIKLCQQKNIKFHVRSLFLQGLLFIEHDKLPIYFAPYQEKLKCFSTLAKHLNCSKLALALVIVAQNSLKTKVNDTSEPNDIIEKVVVGVCSAKQLTEIVNAYQQAQNLPISMQELLSLADDRVGFINPAMWAPETS